MRSKKGDEKEASLERDGGFARAPSKRSFNLATDAAFWGC